MARDRRPHRSICLNLKEGNNLDELRSAYASKADAVTHELEDHCPARFKDVARKNIRQVLDDQGHEKPTFVINEPQMRTAISKAEQLVTDLDRDLGASTGPRLFGELGSAHV